MTEVFWGGKRLKKLEIFQTGDDGEFVWLRGTFLDGTKKSTMYLKGTV